MIGAQIQEFPQPASLPLEGWPGSPSTLRKGVTAKSPSHKARTQWSLRETPSAQASASSEFSKLVCLQDLGESPPGNPARYMAAGNQSLGGHP
jgi:hypothetical protein